MANGKQSFFISGNFSSNIHPLYERVRDDSQYAEAKSAIEDMWAQFRTFCDNHFREDAQNHFPARLWEMYLGVSFMKNGWALLPTSSSDYPDLCVQTDEGRLWVEAVVPDRGCGVDRLPESKERISRQVPEREISLRFAGVLRKKLMQIMKWKTEEKIDENDRTIIAVCGNEIYCEYWYFSLGFYLLKVLFGIGDLVCRWTDDPAESGELSYNSRHSVTKDSGSEVGTCVFGQDSYSAISGIIYSNSVSSPFPYLFGSEMLLYHNPNASRSIPFGMLSFLGEMELDKETGEPTWNSIGAKIREGWDLPI